MTATTTPVSAPAYGGRVERMPLIASEAVPKGAAVGLTTAGYARNYQAGDRFVGHSEQDITADHWAAFASPANGDLYIEVRTGRYVVELTVSGAAIDDAFHQRDVYATDNATYSLTPGVGSRVGRIIGLRSSGVAQVEVDSLSPTGASAGLKSVSATATLTAEDLGKTILGDTQGGAFTITLPAAADCTGKGFTFVRAGTGVNALTLDGAGSETIDGSATYAAMDAANDSVTIVSNGTGWIITATKLA